MLVLKKIEDIVTDYIGTVKSPTNLLTLEHELLDFLYVSYPLIGDDINLKIKMDPKDCAVSINLNQKTIDGLIEYYPEAMI